MLRRSPNKATPAQLDDYYKELEPQALAPLWTVHQEEIAIREPKSKAVPHVWHWNDLRPLARRAGDLVGTEHAERRVLRLLNPGLGGKSAITHTLFAGIQILMPHEIARTHRHSQAALRFIIEGEGAYTVVEGEKIVMRRGDLVLTPNWTWHDHGNETEDPVLWLDGLDIPLVSSLEAGFYEQYQEGDVQTLTQPSESSVAKYGLGALRPTWEWYAAPYSPLWYYAWEQTRSALARLADAAEGSPFDGVIMEYVNPLNSGPAMPTIGCLIQMLRPGQKTKTHRHTTSVVYHVVEGRGMSVVDGQRLGWEERDVFCLPTWAVHEHINTDSERPAILFSFTDAPVIKALGLFRERVMETQI